jgi:plastocyanin
MKVLWAIPIGLGIVCSAQACTIEGGCDCDAPHEAMASEPAFVMTAAPPRPSFSTTVVHVFNFDYSTNPSSGPIVDATISAGDSIQWQVDSGFHSVTSVAGSSPAYDSGVGFSNFSQVFNTPGVYQYYCSLHGFDNGNGTAGGMAGTITVLAIPEPGALALAIPVCLIARRRNLPRTI